DGEFVGNLRLQRHQLANVHAGNIRLDRLEFTAILDGRVRFQVVQIDVTGTAVEVDHDNGLVRRTGIHCPLRLQTQQIRQRQSADGQRADFEKLATRVAVAEFAAFLSMKGE